MDPSLIEDPYEFQKLLGFEIVDWREDYARFDLPLGPHLGNRYAIPHGGVYATLLDTVMGFAGCYTGSATRKQLAMTLTLNVSFLSQPQGNCLIAEGRRTGGGRRIFFADSTLRDDTGITIATGTAAFRYRG